MGEIRRDARGDLLDEPLAVLVAPTAVTGESTRGTTAPVHGTVLLGPRDVLFWIVLDAAHEVPGGWVKDVLEGGDFGL